MEIIFFDKALETKQIVNDVKGIKKSKVNVNGRKQWCYICYLEFWTKTYPCTRFELIQVTAR